MTVAEAAKFRRKPGVVEAMRYNLTGSNLQDLVEWTDGAVSRGAIFTWLTVENHQVGDGGSQPVVLEPGTWVVKEPDGSGFYPCKPDIFDATYEPAEASS